MTSCQWAEVNLVWPSCGWKFRESFWKVFRAIDNIMMMYMVGLCIDSVFTIAESQLRGHKAS
jgi:hypothetical protein